MSESQERPESKQHIAYIKKSTLMNEKNEFSPEFSNLKKEEGNSNVANCNKIERKPTENSTVRLKYEDQTMDLNNDSRLDSFGGNITKNTGLRMEDLSPISNNLIDKSQNFHLQSFRDQQDTENSIFIRDKSFNEPISYIEEIKQGFSLTNESFNNKSSDRI